MTSTLEHVALAVSTIALISWQLREHYHRRLIRRLVTKLHARGHHAAAHQVRMTLLPGVFPSLEEVKLERGLPADALDEALLDTPKRCYRGIAECPNMRPHSQAADLRKRLKEEREREGKR